MSGKKSINLNECYIAFLDILGYKNKILKSNYKEELLYLKIINDSFNETISQIKKEKNYKNEFNHLKYKTFSDNIVLALPKKGINSRIFLYYIRLIKNLCFSMLTKYKLVLRGGVSCGNYFQNSKISYGSGLVSAYLYEGEALYPRIVFDKKVIDDLIANIDMRNTRFLQFKKSLIKLINKHEKNKITSLKTIILINEISLFHYDAMTDEVCNLINFLINIKKMINKNQIDKLKIVIKDDEFLRFENIYNSAYVNSIHCFYKDYLIPYYTFEKFYTLDYFEKDTSFCIIPEINNKVEDTIKIGNGKLQMSASYLGIKDAYQETVNNFFTSKEVSIMELKEIKNFIFKQIKVQNDTRIIEKYVWLSNYFNFHIKKILNKKFISLEEYQQLLISDITFND